MGFIHKSKGEHFGLEERRESFVILWGGDIEEHGIFVYHQQGVSGGMELGFDRLRELRELMQHPAIQKVLDEEHVLFQPKEEN